MRVSDVGEFGLIRLLSSTLEHMGVQHNLLVGIGDDAAAWQGAEFTTLATTDTLVEGVHFTEQCTWEEVGWKALAINLSDIAAMGGSPKYALVALTLPADTETTNVVSLYEGIAKAAKEFGVAIAGGNVSSAPTVTVTITLIGEADLHGILTRSAARPGDMIAVTGYLGSSAAGQRMLAENLKFNSATTALFRDAHLRPQPRVPEGKLLVSQGVHAAIDMSDGLISDMAHLCEQSHVGALLNVNELPIHPMMRAAFQEEALDLALSGGEDYELLFTAEKDIIERVKQQMDCPTTIVGECTSDEPGTVTLLDKDGKPFPWEQKGWDHFSKRHLTQTS